MAIQHKDTDDPFSGIYVAIMKPFNEDLSCNYDILAEHATDLLENGCNGIVLFGTTGEGISFSLKERIAIIQALIERGIPSKKLMIGVTFSSIDDAVELIQASINFKCSSILMQPPYFFKDTTDDGIIAYYTEVLNRINGHVNVFLYNIPQLTYAPITHNVIRTLRKAFPDKVIGIKEGSGNLEYTKNLTETFKDFKVFGAIDRQISQNVKDGVIGTISAYANICPKLICDVYNKAKNNNNSNENRDEEIYEIRSLLVKYNFITALKVILAGKKGSTWTRLRPPLLQLEAKDNEELSVKALKLNLK